MDLRDQLQKTLGAAYLLERELGGGGMSRVFLAEETRLRRKVVIKVLSPELAQGLSIGRFEREIQTAAALQQANIVPVLTAGDTDGLPFYSMPFVEGESLRARLGRGPFAVTEVIGIVRDVAKALAYAHARGVVHRDIKPDNVLVSGGTAVVVDFGIAKAISAARTGTGSATLTQVGTSIGTPAYMSPEQAAGDPDIDHRADIYSLGAMAYELLTGQPPFAGRTPQRTLAAHMSETPMLVAVARPDTPAPLADLVMACLAKEAGARPQDAAEIVRALESITSGSGIPAMPPILLGGKAMFRKALAVYAVAFVAVAILAKAAIVGIGLPDWVLPGALVVMALGLPVILFTAYVAYVTRRAATATPTFTPGGTRSTAQGTIATIALRASPHVSWYRTMRGGAYALGAFVLVVGAWMAMRALGVGPAGSLLASGKLSESDQLLVADFKATGADSALSTVLAEAMRTSLGQSRVVRLVSVSTIDGALRRMKRPAGAKLDVELARELATREGIKAVISGEVSPLAGGYVMTVKLVAAATGDVIASFQETADGAKDLIAATDRLGRQLRSKVGESLRAVHADPPLAQVTTSSLEALRKYEAGYHANESGDYATAVQLLGEAVALDSTFASAYRTLAQALANGFFSNERSLAALAKAYENRDRMTEPERLLMLATYYDWFDRAKTIETYEQLLSRYPNSGLSQAARSNVANDYLARRDFAKAELYYTKDVALDSLSRFSQLNLVAAQMEQGKVEEARKTLTRAKARFPGDFEAERLDAAVLYSMGKPDSAIVLLQRLAARPENFVAGAGHYSLVWPSMLRGGLAAGIKHIAEFRRRSDDRGAHRPPYDDSLAVFEAMLRVADRPADVARRLDAMLARTPLAPVREFDRPYLRIATVYAMSGQAARARAMLAQYRTTVRDTIRRRMERPDSAYLDAWLAYADGRFSEAVAAFRRSYQLPDGPLDECAICRDADVGRAFDRAGQADSAIAVFEHFVRTTYLGRSIQDGLNLPWITARLGELYEARGNTAKALENYQKFVALWKNADPELQPRVDVVRQKIAKLGGVERKGK
jgi:tetratricopeptide (TPR) repeat protein